MIIVADTGPVNYLILSGHIHLLPQLYGSLILPSSVHRELLHSKAPQVVQHWANALPVWAEVRVPHDCNRFADLGPGEREAIALALETKADFLLMDETQGRQTAVQQGIRVKGTLGVLEEAANRHLIDLTEAVGKLQSTGIFLAEDIVQGVLDRHRKERVEPPTPGTKPLNGDRDIER